MCRMAFQHLVEIETNIQWDLQVCLVVFEATRTRIHYRMRLCATCIVWMVSVRQAPAVTKTYTTALRALALPLQRDRQNERADLSLASC